ncbi:hypothetical protein BJ508DRAFT_53802 [Ascobolus immersus RN42]|uniref:Uncharacterized protein n=1 Tax=Ascobolus immersus RN42 TaxID=1160509 RepID=A0A3N4HKY9_ASCIM|nr:hypothetical protein BJ508DRAFT_53802 [Ascobolus immersus RN42]
MPPRKSGRKPKTAADVVRPEPKGQGGRKRASAPAPIRADGEPQRQSGPRGGRPPAPTRSLPAEAQLPKTTGSLAFPASSDRRGDRFDDVGAALPSFPCYCECDLKGGARHLVKSVETYQRHQSRLVEMGHLALSMAVNQTSFGTAPTPATRPEAPQDNGGGITPQGDERGHTPQGGDGTPHVAGGTTTDKNARVEDVADETGRGGWTRVGGVSADGGGIVGGQTSGEATAAGLDADALWNPDEDEDTAEPSANFVGRGPYKKRYSQSQQRKILQRDLERLQSLAEKIADNLDRRRRIRETNGNSDEEDDETDEDGEVVRASLEERSQASGMPLDLRDVMQQEQEDRDNNDSSDDEEEVDSADEWADEDEDEADLDPVLNLLRGWKAYTKRTKMNYKETKQTPLTEDEWLSYALLDIAAAEGMTKEARRKIRRLILGMAGRLGITPWEERKAKRKLSERTGIAHKRYDVCPSGCFCYAAKPKADHCPVCKTPRPNPTDNLRPTFDYIPLIPRLRLQYSDPTRARSFKGYRESFLGKFDLNVSDFWNGGRFTKLRDELGLFETTTCAFGMANYTHQSQSSSD